MARNGQQVALAQVRSDGELSNSGQTTDTDVLVPCLFRSCRSIFPDFLQIKFSRQRAESVDRAARQVQVPVAGRMCQRRLSVAVGVTTRLEVSCCI